MIFQDWRRRIASLFQLNITVNVFGAPRAAPRKAVRLIETRAQNEQPQLPRPALRIRLGPIRQEPITASVGNFKWKQITDEIGAQRKK